MSGVGNSPGTERYILFCAPNTYAMIAHAVLEELSVAYAVHWVTLFSDHPDREFLAASPHGRVPALAGPDGTVFESGAIASYLAEKYPGAGLGVLPGDPRRGRFLQWLHYLGSTLQPEVLIQYHPEFYFADAKDQDRLKKASLGRLGRVLEVIDQALRPGPYFFGDHRTVCDYCLALQAIWPPIYPGSIADYPGIERLTASIVERPAVRRVLAVHEQAWARTHNRTAGMNSWPPDD
jgi:glutathione S-transferase